MENFSENRNLENFRNRDFRRSFRFFDFRKIFDQNRDFSENVKNFLKSVRYFFEIGFRSKVFYAFR